MTPIVNYLLAVCLILASHDVAITTASPVIIGSGTSTSTSTTAKPRKLHGRFLHITDIHPDEFYQPYTSPLDENSCHRAKGHAGYYGAETTSCDSPTSLVNATFAWLKTQYKDEFDFVLWTGDSARHDNDPERIPRHASEVRRTNNWIADMFVDTFSNDQNEMTIPVVPNIGNNDFLPHNIFYPGPNEWLQFYASAWRRFIPEYERHSFQFGGWFYVEVVPNHLAVFSLNTMYFFDRNAATDGCAEPWEPGFKHLEWLRVQLQLMRQRNMKAILIGHVPPARTEGKQLWSESCWQKYTLWLKQYRDVVTASIYGHMNIDHFLLQDTEDLIIPSIQDQNRNQIDHGRIFARESLDDAFTIQSKEDYLRELRLDWSKLPKKFGAKDKHGDSAAEPESESDSKDLGDKWASRFQLSLIGSSIVPNYFPSFRIYDYDVSGLENVPVWKDEYLESHVADEPEATEPEHVLVSTDSMVGADESEDNWDEDDELQQQQELKRGLDSQKDKNNEKKMKHHPKPNGPNLVVPEGPSKSAPPGPAYSVQPLSLLGYTHYFANLTRINNLGPERDEHEDANVLGNQGEQGKKPDEDPTPLPFEFEVEYSTYDDKVFALKDLTVLSYVKLAYRIGQKQDSGGKHSLAEEDMDQYSPDEVETNEEVGPHENKGKKHKKKKNKKHGKHAKTNKVWLEFLHRAFVSSVSKEELEAREEDAY